MLQKYLKIGLLDIQVPKFEQTEEKEFDTTELISNFHKINWVKLLASYYYHIITSKQLQNTVSFMLLLFCLSILCYVLLFSIAIYLGCCCVALITL
jgi:hypothetical protein